MNLHISTLCTQLFLCCEEGSIYCIQQDYYNKLKFFINRFLCSSKYEVSAHYMYTSCSCSCWKSLERGSMMGLPARFKRLGRGTKQNTTTLNSSRKVCSLGNMVKETIVVVVQLSLVVPYIFLIVHYPSNVMFYSF